MFESLFEPKGVAVIGSASPGKLGNILVNRLLNGGFKQVYPVNPKAMGVGDCPGYNSVLSIAESGLPVDMAIIACPVATVAAVMEDCGKGGVKAAIVITSGFREAGNSDAEAEILAMARKYGIRFVGPNCAGLLNTHAHLYATLEQAPPKGNVALLSQSGSIGGIFMSWATEEGLGISKFISYGNSLDWSVIEYLEYLKDDPQTDVIALYLEQIYNGREFMATMRRVTKVKPVVIIKAGRTATGGRATMSHTGSMAGEDRINDVALLDSGAIRVDTVQEMFDLCKALATMPMVEGNRLLIITNSGGPGIMATDKAEMLNLAVNEPSAGLKTKLRTFLPPHAGLRNPVDITVEGTADWYGGVIKNSMEEFDAAIVVYVGTPYLEAMPVAKAVVEASKATGKPIITNFYVGTDIEDSKAYLWQHGIPNFDTGEGSAWVVQKMLHYYEHQFLPIKLAPIPRALETLEGKGLMAENQAVKLLKTNGIPVPQYAFAQKPEDVSSACQQVGYPVVMKVVSPQIIHKSDVGGVKLNLANQAEALAAFDALADIAKGKDFKGVMIYPMLKPGVEVLLGLKRDKEFGAVVMFGFGGIYSEIFNDTVLQIGPVNLDQAKEMIRSVKSYPILAGARGGSPKDVEALAEAIVDLSNLLFLYPDISEIDLNPVFVYQRGISVADVRIIL